jgi:hypothetical protein
MNTSVTTKSPDSPSTSPPEPISARARDLYLDQWLLSQTNADSKLGELEGINSKLGDVNRLLAELGKLQIRVTDSGDARKLTTALNGDPGWVAEINVLVAKVNLTPPLFPNSADDRWGAPDAGRITNATVRIGTARAGEARNVLQAMSEADFQELSKRLSPTGTVSISKSRMTDANWVNLIQRMMTPLAGNLERFAFLPDSSANPSEQKFNRDFNDAVALHIPGGLRETYTGADVYAAVQTLRGEVTNLSNQLQSKSTAVNQAMQRTTAIMQAITDLMQKFFGSLDKILGST